MVDDMALLHFLKHGESTPRPHLDHIGGSPDVSELTDVGVEQARKVGRYLSRMKLYPSIVAVSTAHQTMETASLALEAMQFRGRIRLTQELLSDDGQKIYDAAIRIDKEAEQRGVYESKYMHAPAAALVFVDKIAMKALVTHIENRSQQWIDETQIPHASLSRICFLDGHAEVDYLGRDVTRY